MAEEKSFDIKEMTSHLRAFADVTADKLTEQQTERARKAIDDVMCSLKDDPDVFVAAAANMLAVCFAISVKKDVH